MRRRSLILLIALGLIVFLAISALLARVLSVGGAERTAITGLVQAEARGDAAAMIRQIQGCGRSASYRYKLTLSLNTPDGVKTGFTSAAGLCLVATARRHGRWLGVVLLHSVNWLTQAEALLNAGFAAERRAR